MLNKINICVFFLVVFVGLKEISFSQNYVSDELYKSARDSMRYEIDEINFLNTEAFKNEQFLELISLYESRRSIPHSLLDYYYNNIKLIKNSPDRITKTLNSFLDNMSDEIGFFNENIAINDSVTLWHLYNINGYHFPEIYYRFEPDTSSQTNVLSFIINEGERYRVDTLNYIGLDSLPASIKNKIQSVKKIKKGRKYFEPDIINEVQKVQNILVNNGYYYSKYDKPFISIDTVTKTDSISVNFYPGKRQRIGKITFIDSLQGQRKISAGTKKRQVQMEQGEWFSRNKLRESETNLTSLGTFELVIIDTTSEFYPQNDSTLNFKVMLIYRNQIEWDAGMFLNQTPLYNYVNLGFSGNINHRNLFNAAQSANLFANASINDISKIIGNMNNLEAEGLLGFKYFQPILWSLGNAKISLSSSFSFSARVIDQFRLHTWAFPIKFPVQLPTFTYFNQMIFDVTFERQEPVNFPDIFYSADNPDGVEFEELFRASVLYTDVYNYLNEPKLNLLTSNLIGITLIGDNKDHPFSPTNGSYTYISLDGWNVFLAHPTISGLSRFFRFQFARSDFFSSNKLAIHAFKVKFGGIYLIDKQNSYVPIERQFFAGGANSVRGWQSRKLHYTDVLPRQDDSIYTEDDYNLLSNIIGSGGLLEFSYEFRYRFHKPDWASKDVAEQISSMGVTFFVDAGNAFHWFAEDVTEVKFTDYFTKLAWAAGAGFRYETPIGPIRIDFALPLYGPVIGRNDNILKRSNILSDTQIHIGIGHAF
jgi:outer membrane protein assembly factor BamA